MKVRSEYAIGFSHGFYVCVLSVALGGFLGFSLFESFFEEQSIVLAESAKVESVFYELEAKVPVIYAVSVLERACDMATTLPCSDVMYAYEYENALIGLVLGESVVIGFKPAVRTLVYEVHLGPPSEETAEDRT
jgi:hypothetical protein